MQRTVIERQLPLNYNRLITLKNDRVTVGILPDVGGRVVQLCTPAGPNLLKADAKEWTKKPIPRGPLSARNRFKAYNGHIVWLGPQNGWWAQQTLNKSRKRRNANWPPDPHLVNGFFKPLHRTASSIVLQGPDSPISGVRLTKKIALHENGDIDFEVSAINIRTEPVAWDLWLNTRVDGYDRCYVPVAENGIERIVGRSEHGLEAMDTAICNGYFTFSPRKPSEGMSQRVAKAFLQPSRGLIAAFCGSYCLKIHFFRNRRELIHREQSQVELYNQTTHVREDALLELEQHAPFCTLEPGQSMSTHQRWEILPYTGGHSHNDHTSFLDSSTK